MLRHPGNESLPVGGDVVGPVIVARLLEGRSAIELLASKGCIKRGTLARRGLLVGQFAPRAYHLGMGGGAITLFHVRGIRIAVDWSWFIVLFIVIVFLS